MRFIRSEYSVVIERLFSRKIFFSHRGKGKSPGEEYYLPSNSNEHVQ